MQSRGVIVEEKGFKEGLDICYFDVAHKMEGACLEFHLPFMGIDSIPSVPGAYQSCYLVHFYLKIGIIKKLCSKK